MFYPVYVSVKYCATKTSFQVQQHLLALALSLQ